MGSSEPKSLLNQLTRNTVGFINAAQQLHQPAQHCETSPGGTLHISSCWATKPQLLSDQQWSK